MTYLFQTTVALPLRPPTSTSKDIYRPSSEIALPSEDKLVAFRELIAGAKIGSVNVGDEVAQYIENDFVDERQTNAAKSTSTVTGDDLVHQIMTAKSVSVFAFMKDIRANQILQIVGVIIP